jgi:hypothetical protein
MAQQAYRFETEIVKPLSMNYLVYLPEVLRFIPKPNTICGR